VSRKYRLPLRRVKGEGSSIVVGSLELTVVSPLDSVLLEVLLDLGASSIFAAAAAAALDSAVALWSAFLRSGCGPELEKDFRLAFAASAAALALVVWFAE
jgi:hypothetical protein